MRRLVVALLLAMLAAAASGQVLEGVIPLPDSLGPLLCPYPGLRGTYSMVTDTTGRMLYVGSESSDVLVIDAISMRRLARISTNSPVSALCLNTRRNKVYCANNLTNAVIVIEGATGQVLGRVPVGAWPLDLCYNAENDRVYCANWDEPSVSVIDCAGDSVVKEVAVPERASLLCHNPSANKMYVGTIRGLATVDCLTDSTVGYIRFAGTPTALCYVPDVNKLYVAADIYLHVVDGSGDSVLSVMRNWMHREMRLAYNPTVGRLYWGSYDHLFAVDVSADTVVCDLNTRHFEVRALVTGRRGKWVYCAWIDMATLKLAVLDGETNTLVCELPLGGFYCPTLHYDSARDMLFSAGDLGTLGAIGCSTNSVAGIAVLHNQIDHMYPVPDEDKVYCVRSDRVGYAFAIDCPSGRATVPLRIGQNPHLPCYNKTGRKLYWPNVVSKDITVTDAAGDSVLATIALPSKPEEVVWDSAANKVFCRSGWIHDGFLVVVDGAGDSVLRTISLPELTHSMTLAADLGKLYVNYRSGSAVIDCKYDSVVKTIVDVGGSSAMCYSSEDRRLYLAASDWLDVLDVNQDSVLARVHAPAHYGTCGLVKVPSHDRVYWPLWGMYPDTIPLVAVIDTRGDSICGWWSTGAPVVDICVDPWSDETFAVGFNDPRLYVIDNSRDTIRMTLPLPISWEARLALDPERRRLFVGTRAGDLCVVRLDTTVVSLADDHARVRQSRLPTVAARRLSLPQGMDADLLDVTGRKAMNLEPGSNDIRRLAPGVYFVRSASGVERQASGVTKVVVTR